jgi:hypothetical protein
VGANPFAPIVVPFDVELVAKALGLKVRRVEGPTEWDAEVVAFEPMAPLEGIDEFLDFSYGTKKRQK